MGMAEAEEIYLQALEHCTRGENAEANILLQWLCCTYRIAPQAFEDLQLSTCSLDGAPVLVYDQALPGSLLTGLQAAFSPSAAFWDGHAYHDAGTSFFSYVHELADAPATLIDAAIGQVHAVLKRTSARRWLRGARRVEWWAHSRRGGDSHQLHFDVNESLLRKGRSAYALQHPLVSCIMYLSDAGGPTLVIDQTSQCTELGRRGWAIRPVTGRLAAFRGELLHGVLPGQPDEDDAHRTTLVLAFWDDAMRPLSGQPGSGPARLPPWRRHPASESEKPTTTSRQGGDDCRRATLHMASAPAAGCGQHRAHLLERWVSDMTLPDAMETSSADLHSQLMPRPASEKIACICPVWVEVVREPPIKRRRQQRTAEGLADAHLPPLRFFLRSASEVYEVYNPV